MDIYFISVNILTFFFVDLVEMVTLEDSVTALGDPAICRRLHGDSLASFLIRNSFSSERAVMHWTRLLRGVLVSPTLKVFKKCGDVAVRDMV